MLSAFILLFTELKAQKLPALIPYRKGDKWGYCDSTKKIIIEPKYDYAYVFQNGFAFVSLNGKATTIDSVGKEKLQPVYTDGYIG